jgi:uncharacterized membrane protein
VGTAVPPDPPSRCIPVLWWVLHGTATLLIVSAIFYIFLDRAPEALPANAPESFRHEDMTAKAASASALKEVISLLVTLSLGLTGVVGFSVRGGLKQFGAFSAINAILLAIYIWLLVFCLKKAYYAYAMIAAQLAEGHFFYARISDQVEEQAVGLVISAIIVAVVLFLNVGINYRTSA